MKEVKKCSISGIAFTMEADAFQVLSRYLESLNDTYRNTDGGKEIVEDIEARIAELILSHQDNSKVVELSLVEEIIAQMGSAEAIREQEGREAPRGEGRIPRRLYRDMDQARLGGVCSGVAKYFGTSPTWIRLLMFLPLILLLLLGWIPFFWWLVPLMSNLLGVFFICYLIMWFAVPAARTARQKLEQNGQRITVQSIEEASAANHDVDADAKPVVAKAVYALGQVVLIVLKLLAGLLVFGLILGACALIIGLFAVGMAGPEVVSVDAGIWTVSLGIMTALVPVLLLIYVLMCLIASRKPSRKAGTLADMLVGADVFIGVSAPNTVTTEMVKTMNKDAIIFACANPTPEIFPDAAKAGGARVISTGRSDYPNQINNVLAFPGIFRGVFDVRASDINEAMKVAAAEALAGLVGDDLSEDYIIPAAFDPRVGPAVAKAVAEAARRSGVARI